jgi:hypothetical protein
MYQTISQISARINPDLVYIFNGRFATTLPQILFCEKNNIKYITHERAGKMNRYCLFDNSIPHSIEYAQNEIEKIWAEGPDNREETGRSFFIERRNRTIQGWISFTSSQKEKLLPGIPENKTIISIFNSTIEEYAAVRGVTNTFLIYEDEITCLTSIFERFKDDPDVFFYVRVHPNLKGSENTQIRGLRGLESKYRNVEIISPESEIDTYALLERSDKVIVFGSTMGVEACFWGIPAIALRKNVYSKLECCYWPQNEGQLEEMIKNSLPPKSITEALKFGYWNQVRGVLFRHYTPKTLFSGKFLNLEIKLNAFQRTLYYLLRITEIKNFSELTKSLKTKLKI